MTIYHFPVTQHSKNLRERKITNFSFFFSSWVLALVGFFQELTFTPKGMFALKESHKDHGERTGREGEREVLQ
jgi:hypothetical protein